MLQATASHRRSPLCVVAVLLSGAACLPAIGDEGIALEELLEVVRISEQRRLEQNRMEAARRAHAAVQRQEVIRQMGEIESRIECVESWSRDQAELVASGLIPAPRSAQWYLERLADLRAKTRQRLLEFPERSKAAAVRGGGLNFFLHEFGPIAFDHRVLLAHRKNLPDDGSEQRILTNVAAGFRIPTDVLRHVRYRRGVTGTRLTGRFGEEPLDVHWPATLRQPEYDALRKRIEEGRSAALAELADGPISPATGATLMADVSEMVATVRQEKSRRVRASGGTYGTVAPWYAAERFCRFLVEGTARLLEAESSNDVEIPTFEGDTVEELLVHMHENGLEFAEADANGEVAYLKLFDLTSQYCIEVYGLRLMVADDAQRLNELRSRENDLNGIENGSKLSNDQRAGIASDAVLAALALWLKR